MTCRKCGGALDQYGSCPMDRWEQKTAKLLEQPMSDRMRAWILTASPYRPVYGAPVGAPSITPSKLNVWFDGVQMVQSGMGLGLAAEHRIAKVFRQKEFTIAVGLGQGRHRAYMWTTDLSFDYVRINASYRS